MMGSACAADECTGRIYHALMEVASDKENDSASKQDVLNAYGYLIGD